MSFDYFFETVKDSQYIYKDPKLNNLTDNELIIAKEKDNNIDLTVSLSKKFDIINSIQLNCSARAKIVGSENSYTYLDTWINKDVCIKFPSILSSDKLQLCLLHISCPDDKIKIIISGVSFSSDIKNKLANTCVFASLDYTDSKIPVQYVMTKNIYEKHICVGYFD